MSPLYLGAFSAGLAPTASNLTRIHINEKRTFAPRATTRNLPRVNEDWSEG